MHQADCAEHHTAPKVIACGYRHVRIPKSGNTFPAWLVQLRHDCFVWRCKQDFVRLARRSCAANGSSMYDFPKSALTRLAQAAPWMRTDMSLPQHIDDICYGRNDWGHHMIKSMRQLDQFLANVAAKVRTVDPITKPPATVQSLGDAYRQFCQSTDSENVICADYQPATSQRDTVRGQALGQYFCTRENAQQVVDEFLSLYGDAPKDASHWLIVEPSCGHGGLLRPLLHELDKIHGDKDLMPQIVGFDIDPSVIDYCQYRSGFGQYGVKFIVGDFLRSRRFDVCAPGDDAHRILFIGGPPYTASNDQERNTSLPLRFVEHALTEWHAHLIVFIMPERCARIEYALPEGVGVRTISFTRPCTFLFQGLPDAVVTQPSVIQCFLRE